VARLDHGGAETSCCAWDQYFSSAARCAMSSSTRARYVQLRRLSGSVSTAPIQAMEISLYPAYNVLSKMIHADPRCARTSCASGTSQWPATIFRGTDQWGERYGYILVDPIGGAIGAFSPATASSTGGQARTPMCKLPTSSTPSIVPLLFLYRKE